MIGCAFWRGGTVDAAGPDDAMDQQRDVDMTGKPGRREPAPYGPVVDWRAPGLRTEAARSIANIT